MMNHHRPSGSPTAPRTCERSLDPAPAPLLWSRGRMGQRHLLVLLALAGPAWAAEETELASAFDEDDPFDFNVRVGYLRESRKAAIKREYQAPGEGISIVKDLRYKQLRNILNMRGEISIWQDLQLHVEAPLVLGDHRQLEFDHKTDGPCITAAEVRPGGTNTDDRATCVSNMDSTTVRDGMVRGVTPEPRNFDGQTIASDDIAPDDPDTSVDEGDPQGFHLPVRSGLDQLHVGIDWGIVSQERDDTKPTWVVGVEWRIPVDGKMSYSPNDPAGDKDVGRQVHELVFSTNVSKRWTYVEPYMKFWYMMPIPKDDSPFLDYRGGQDKVKPQQKAGTEFGFEIIPWQVPEEKQKLGIEFGGAIRAHFEGRGYSEMWEVFSQNPALDGPCRPGWINCDMENEATGSPDFDGDGVPDGLIRHPGVTDIENYLSLESHAAVRVQMGEWVKFRIGVGLEHDQEHIITFADGGEDIRDTKDVDRDGNINEPSGRIEPDDPFEVHPMHRPLIDQTGRRYRTEDTFVFSFFAAGTLLF